MTAEDHTSLTPLLRRFPLKMSTTTTIEFTNISPPEFHEASSSALQVASKLPKDDEHTIAVAQTTLPIPTKSRIVLTIFTLSMINLFSSFSNACITVGLPVIARSIHLPRSLYLWPSSVFGLTCGASLLIAGSIADIVGARGVDITGVVLLGVFTLVCGFANTGIQLVVFRALQGIALAMHLPASVAIIASAVPSGRARNIGFGCLGMSQPLGFAVGLVVSGIMIDKVGWRSVFYLSGSATLAAAVVASRALPKVKTGAPTGMMILWKKVCEEIDWVGGIIASAGLAILAYVLA